MKVVADGSFVVVDLQEAERLVHDLCQDFGFMYGVGRSGLGLYSPNWVFKMGEWTDMNEFIPTILDFVPREELGRVEWPSRSRRASLRAP